MQFKLSFFVQASIAILIILWSVFSMRWVLTVKYDPSYYTDWYGHSQWQIPLSPRIMGDAELYQVSGYSLASGGDAFQINPETPPLIKYMYGFSLLKTSNPYFVSLAFYFLSIISFGCLSLLAFPKNHQTRFLAVLLFLLNPLFFSQIGQVGLDLPQMCFLILHCVFLFLAIQQNKTKRAIFYLVSATFLGAFAGTKIGFFLPVILGVDAWILFRSKQLKWSMLLILGCVLTYVLSYFPYFLQGHTLVDWFIAQKWIVHFYLASHIMFWPGMIFPSLLVGYFFHWTNGLTPIKEWTIVWPLSLGVFSTFLTRNLSQLHKAGLKNQDLFWQYMLLLTAGLLFSCAIIPFWPRYLMLVMPFLLLLVAQFLSPHRKICLLIISILTIQFLWYSFPQPQEMVKISTDAWRAGSYPEIYNFTSQETQDHITRQNFVYTLQSVQSHLEDPSISITSQVPAVFPWQNTLSVPLQVTYQTNIGNLVVPSELHLVRENNQWRVAWQWQNVLPSFDSYSQVILSKDQPPVGTLTTQDHFILSQGGLWPFISIIPNKLRDSEQTNDLLTQLTYAHGPEIRVALFVTHPGSASVPIGFLRPFYSTDIFQELKKDSATVVDQRFTRVYDTNISQPPSLNLVQDMEKAHPELNGQLGGKITIIKPSGERIVILQKDAQAGQNFTLSQTFMELFQRPNR